MKLKIRHVVMAAIAVSASGAAMALNVNSTTTGNVILNVWDPTTHDDFIFDTGLTQSTFSSTGSYSYNVTTDSNAGGVWSQFLSDVGSDPLTWNVVSGYGSASGTTTNTITAFTTGSSAPGTSGTIANSLVNSAVATLWTYEQGGNAATGVNTSSNASVVLGSSTSNWDQDTEPTWNGNLKVTTGTDGASVGTALAFYSVATTGQPGTANNSPSTKATLSTFTYTWLFQDTSNGYVLSYNPSSSTVPLPAPLMLLLSGLAATGILGRRRSSGAIESVAA